MRPTITIPKSKLSPSPFWLVSNSSRVARFLLSLAFAFSLVALLRNHRFRGDKLEVLGGVGLSGVRRDPVVLEGRPDLLRGGDGGKDVALRRWRGRGVCEDIPHGAILIVFSVNILRIPLK